MVEVIEARWVLPVEPWEVIDDGAVAIDAGEIVTVGPAAQVAAQFPQAPRVRLPEHVLMPGLVNAHTHAAMTLLRGFADDVPLMTWLHERIWPAEGRWVDPQFVADGTRLAAAEMLAGGVTCFSDMYFFPVEAIEAARAAGIRILSGQVVVDATTNYASDAAEHVEKALTVIHDYQGVPGVHLALAPHAPYTVSDEIFAELVGYCEQFDLPLHTHVHETRAEVDQGVAQYGVRPLERLDRLGVVTSRLIAAHAVHLTDAEIALLAERDAAVVHCPASNLKLASGVARLTDWLGSGLRVGFGTDGVASNNRLDLLDDVRLASLLAKGTSGDAAAVPARQALHTATLGGARAIGLGDSIGSLSAGKAADLIALDLGGFEVAPLYDVASHVVYCAQRQHVTDVWVAGRRLKDDGQLVREDPHELAALARRWQQRIG
jgi:5-methylthioadenosine/S-adenosylhomocysteine deaminase